MDDHTNKLLSLTDKNIIPPTNLLEALPPK
ncbi:hypothetical protein IGK31_002929 [Enterococcus sp. DIV1288f]